jgi:high-affinity Fe2+/Pb2+ permease
MSLFITLAFLCLALIGLNRRLRGAHLALIAATLISIAAILYAIAAAAEES